MSTRDPYKVGLGLIAVIAILGVVLVLLAKASFGTHDHEAVFKNTGGLRPGEAVEVRGVQVGKVTSVSLDYTDRDPQGSPTVLVKFNMNSDISLGQQTTATVKVATLLGTHYLEVDPSGPGALGRIPLASTNVPYNLQDALDKGSDVVGKLDTKVIAKSLVTLADTLGDSKNAIGPALQGVSAVSMLIEKRGEQTAALLTAASAVTKELKDNSGNLTVLMQQANLVLTEINSRQDAIKQLLSQSVTLATMVSSLIQNSRADLKPALTSLDAVIQTLNSQSKQLQAGFDLLAPSVRYVANAAGNGPWLDLWGQDPLLPADDSTGGLL
ncbi:MlaD family protein [Nocardioides baekrokdamisoli]|uniref:MlaD family protein n=1 Tax=Nocardioides baekrokdamisoli TaxID=1804624 RepID=UPI0013DE590C|nr:MlaD family protein [Nocardioides baekrokdamisoli]